MPRDCRRQLAFSGTADNGARFYGLFDAFVCGARGGRYRAAFTVPRNGPWRVADPHFGFEFSNEPLKAPDSVLFEAVAARPCPPPEPDASQPTPVFALSHPHTDSCGLRCPPLPDPERFCAPRGFRKAQLNWKGDAFAPTFVDPAECKTPPRRPAPSVEALDARRRSIRIRARAAKYKTVMRGPLSPRYVKTIAKKRVHG